MKTALAALTFLLVALFNPTEARPSSENNREEIFYTPQTIDEEKILSTIQSAYKEPSSGYACYWNGARLKGDFIHKFSNIYSDRIIKRFFKTNDCLLVASARRGFTLLDDPELWSDKDIYRIKVSKPLITKDLATIEVRLWSAFNSETRLPQNEYDGGVILYMVRSKKNSWLIDNIIGTDTLGAKPFNSLIEENHWQIPPWKGMDYSKSLIHPKKIDDSPSIQ